MGWLRDGLNDFGFPYDDLGCGHHFLTCFVSSTLPKSILFSRVCWVLLRLSSLGLRTFWFPLSCGVRRLAVLITKRQVEKRSKPAVVLNS